MAIAAVSSSRISPTMITSGSPRRKARIAAANVKPIFGLHLDLAEAGLRDLDGVLRRPDLPLRRVDVTQHGVERRRLAGAGRPHAQDRP